MCEKIVVKGEGQHPLYAVLTQAQPQAQTKADSHLKTLLESKGLLSGEAHDIMWNFEKFLVNRRGEVIARFAPDITAEDPRLLEAIEIALAE